MNYSRIESEFKPSERHAWLRQLYGAFGNPSDFEEFVKVLLAKIGLEEVQLVGRAGDGGIDLTALRRGIEGLSNADDIPYIVQAKRYKPESNVSARDVRAFRGILTNGAKGLFVTTGHFTRQSVEFASRDKTRPIILIDGPSLISLCIQHELGFVARPQFRAKKLREVLSKTPVPTVVGDSPVVRISKVITQNNIRAHILPIPRAVMQLIPPNTDKILLAFSRDDEPKQYRINRKRRYVGGITGQFRKHGLITEAGEHVPKLAEWLIDTATRLTTVEFSQE